MEEVKDGRMDEGRMEVGWDIAICIAHAFANGSKYGRKEEWKK